MGLSSTCWIAVSWFSFPKVSTLFKCLTLNILWWCSVCSLQTLEVLNVVLGHGYRVNSFVKSLHSTLAQFYFRQSPWFHHFYLHPRCPLREENDAALASPVLLCLLFDREWTMAGWQLAPPLSPLISSRLLHCVWLPPWQLAWTLTDYFGVKFQLPPSNQTLH